MRILLLVVASFLLSRGAWAKSVKPEAPNRSWYVNLFVFSTEMRFERDSSQHILDRRPLNFAGGMRKENSNYLLEYTSFSEKTGNATVGIDRRFEQLSVWWKESLIHFDVADVFLGVGLGAYQEKVTTRLTGSRNVTDASDFQEMGGLSVGVQSKFARFVLLSLEGRALFGRNLDPNPQGSAVARLGVEF